MTTCSYFDVYVHSVKIQDSDLSLLPGGATAPVAAAAAAACC
jgi:hypothetical protein